MSVLNPQPTRRRARLRDVAELAGVDVSVASRALRHAADLNVRPETQRRIEQAARTLGYVANPAATSLKTTRTSSLGIVFPSLLNPAAALIAQGATEQAAAAGYLLLITTGHDWSMLERRVDGILLASATSEPRSLPDPHSLDVPLLQVNRHEPGPFPGIVVDDRAGARLATEYLLSLGHVNVGHVAGPQQADTSRRRRAGFESTLRDSGLPVRGEWIVEGPYDEAGGYNAASRILRQNPRPTALFVSNLLATVGVMAAARRLNLEMPGDLSLITFDDVPLAIYLNPPVTTIRLPLADLGRRAVNAMIGIIGGAEQGEVVIDTPPELVVRQSCASPR